MDKSVKRCDVMRHDWRIVEMCNYCGIERASEEHKIQVTLNEVKAAFAKLTPEQQQAMWEEQRQSWVRAEQGMKD